MEVLEGETFDMAVAATRYGDLFQLMLWIGVGSGIAYFVLSPLVRRWMHGVR